MIFWKSKSFINIILATGNSDLYHWNEKGRGRWKICYYVDVAVSTMNALHKCNECSQHWSWGAEERNGRSSPRAGLQFDCRCQKQANVGRRKDDDEGWGGIGMLKGKNFKLKKKIREGSCPNCTWHTWVRDMSFLCKDWLDVDSEGVVGGQSSRTELSWR